MKITRIGWIALLLMICSAFTCKDAKDIKVKITPDELKLYELITEYRKASHLPVIPLSRSLTYVAHTHCLDLLTNKPDSIGNCNMHSWSDKGNWTACCYTPDHKQAECMWNKPRELTNYTGNGYEIACINSMRNEASLSPGEALESWKGSMHHNNVILNKDIWKDIKWNAIGIGMNKGVSVVWFGAEPDPDGEPGK